uniref:Uncharacterized protein n=1 Tax=Meloidogyne enterolobii TaxID=390850 RepID=A0A6V7UMB0_MELEN|nr:unnamed protein product [Meloidogyne enterolobii]
MPPQPYQFNSNTISSNRMAGSGSPPRHAPLLRRQTSNLPGQVHHMAVMVAPSRVDYSVNKGGLRSWAVIIVFVLLCSAILNIFSEEGEGRYREEDFDDKEESLAAPEEQIGTFKDEEEAYEKRYYQKEKVEESKGKRHEAFGEEKEGEEDDDNEEEEEVDEEEDEDEEEEEEEENEDLGYVGDREELMLARLSEKGLSSSKRKGGGGGGKEGKIPKLMELRKLEKFEQEERKQKEENDEEKKCTAPKEKVEEEKGEEDEEKEREEENEGKETRMKLLSML